LTATALKSITLMVNAMQNGSLCVLLANGGVKDVLTAIGPSHEQQARQEMM